MHTVLVLGGYGFFGIRICRALSRDKSIRLLVAGHNLERARHAAHQLGLGHEHALEVDATADDLALQLRRAQVETIIHAAGPFQGQDYHVVHAAISAGANYIDLADGRDFVVGISELDESARKSGVFVTSGASSLPALSSAVVDRYIARFRQLKSIRHGIASGARSPGLATVRGVFGYCGKPFSRLVDGQMQLTHGWLNLKRQRFAAPVGLAKSTLRCSPQSQRKNAEASSILCRKASLRNVTPCYRSKVPARFR